MAARPWVPAERRPTNGRIATCDDPIKRRRRSLLGGGWTWQSSAAHRMAPSPGVRTLRTRSTCGFPYAQCRQGLLRFRILCSCSDGPQPHGTGALDVRPTGHNESERIARTRMAVDAKP